VIADWLSDKFAIYIVQLEQCLSGLCHSPPRTLENGKIIEPCAMKSENPFSRKGEKLQQKHSPFPPSETERKERKILELC